MTGKIAPHEGHEIDLVISGDKPLAVIEKRKDPEQYRRGLLYIGFPPGVFRRIRSDDKSGPEVIVSRSWNLIQDYLELLVTGHGRLGPVEYARAMGALFGYSQDDVDEYLRANINCDCSKCTGPPSVPESGKVSSNQAFKDSQEVNSFKAFKDSQVASVRRTMYHA